jgi:hypothetical protein
MDIECKMRTNLKSGHDNWSLHSTGIARKHKSSSWTRNWSKQVHILGTNGCPERQRVNSQGKKCFALRVFPGTQREALASLPCNLAAVEARRPSRERELWCSSAWKSLRTSSRSFVSISRVQQLCADSQTLCADPATQNRPLQLRNKEHLNITVTLVYCCDHYLKMDNTAPWNRRNTKRKWQPVQRCVLSLCKRKMGKVCFDAGLSVACTSNLWSNFVALVLKGTWLKWQPNSSSRCWP